ncbi:hypothetical protein BJ138DRAFT_389267 [Hygrophoropsis aurantiaca]|uniref:Uncharacterized protein n=1 Tax=Hygrophoropsis aurantiaca TaxID=72124 RepID=A0ACB8A4R9_9AGAM|nr:hypothetical protein BJ138DRAFT_389267 [Hygrophoropsis aurantiaca]
MMEVALALHNFLYDPADVAIGIQVQQLDRVLVSAVALYLFDYALNLDVEVAYVLTSKFSITQCLYFACRYLPIVLTGVQWPASLVSNINADDCPMLFLINVWLSIVVFCCSGGIFLCRAYALWGCSKRILMILLFSFMVALTPVLIITGIASAAMTGPDLVTEPSPLITGNCFERVPDQTYFICYLLLLLFEAEIFIFTVYRVHVHYRHKEGHLLKVMIKHGIFYFIFALLFSLTNIVVIFLLPTDYSGTFGVLQALSQALVVTRMQLQLWTADHDRPSTSLQLPTSTIAFAIPEENMELIVSQNSGE